MKLRRPNKREIMLFGVLIAAVAYTTMLDSKARRVKEANKKMRVQSINTGQAIPYMPDNLMRVKKSSLFGEAVSTWGMDPFNKPFARDIDREQGKAAAGAGEVDPVELVLQGVVIVGEGRVALINGIVCFEGDTLLHVVVENISRNKVRLRRKYDGSEIVLKFQ